MMSTVLLTALMWAGPAAAAHSVAAEAVVDLQRLDVVLTPAAHSVSVRSRLHVTGPGVLRFDLTDRAEIESLQIDGRAADHGRAGGRAAGPIEVTVGEGRSILSVRYRARLEEDVASGERPGQIHNFAVQAHVGEDGVFLSDGSAWHPRPLGPDGRPALHQITVDVAPLGDWSIVAAGDPVGDAALDQPCWRWSTPRPVDGMAIVGNRHRIQGIVHETAEGPVEIVMHVPDAHARLAPMFLEAAAGYLDLYVPRLGRFPYRRFSIVENFFSSGFAFPGFTVLGPQVVGMAPRSLAPGYLDHELLHCWWGNGVYVDSRDGNWCEALTSYGANYFRRVAEEGAEAGRAYRRGILMKLSTDPATLDDGPLGAFGSADPSTPGPDRFVGYDKGAFVFLMLGDVLATAAGAPDGEALVWSSTRRFARDHLGRRAGWAELQAAFEAEVPGRAPGWLDGYFEYWVREHNVPRTLAAAVGPGLPEAFVAQLPAAPRPLVAIIRSADQEHVEIDPAFRIYRVLPPGQLVPTIAGTTGPGGLHVVAPSERPEIAALLAQLETDPGGENLLLIGRAAAADHASLLARAVDRVGVEDGAFTVGGERYAGAGQAILHTMAHPDRPGRFVTVFLSNGEAGWSRLRL
ncbi:MAG: M1 aminopeptidase family protein, partial [Planctomycetota bacterium]